MNDTLLIVLKSMKEVKLPQIKFIVSLISSFMCFSGHANYRNLGRYSEVTEKTIWRWSKRVFDFCALNVGLISTLASEELLGVIDASFIEKSGKSTEGLGLFWDGSSSRVRKGLEISSLGLVDIKRHTCFSLGATQTVINGVSRILQAVEQIRMQANNLNKLGVKLLLADGYYAKHDFVKGLTDSGFDVISKFRIDANFRFINTETYKGRGRPKKYAGKVDLNDLSRFEHHSQSDDDTDIYCAELYSMSLKRIIKVVIMKKQAGQKIILFSTDCSIPADKIIKHYKSRFQIEFMFRDAKQHTGLQDCQARSTIQINNHINASFTALNLLKIQDVMKNIATQTTHISILTRKTRTQHAFLIKKVFGILDIKLTDYKFRHVTNLLANSFDIAA